MRTIAIFIAGYLPGQKYGGPVTSISNLTEEFGDEYKIYIITSNHDLKTSTVLPGIHSGWNQVGNAEVVYLYEREFTKKKFTELLTECKADVAYLSSVFSYRINFPAIKAAKSLNIPVILAPRGELCANALRLGQQKKMLYLYALKMLGIFNGIYYHTTSREEHEAVRDILNVSEEKIFEFPNMPGRAYHGQAISKTPGQARFVFLSRLHEKKNLLFAIEETSKLKGDIVFDIYGLKEQPEYWEKCQRAIDHAAPNVKIVYKGMVEPGTTKEVFSRYHAFVFPTLSENYGHVISEAVLSGCMVVVSKGTTPWDDIQGQGGFACSLDKPEEWQTALNTIVGMDEKAYSVQRQRLAEYAERKNALEEIKGKYRAMFDVHEMKQ